jgi:tRNA (adenine57-N1/adenine58-N1)-methyltransferase
MKRESQIIYPEDIGLILTYGNLNGKTNILEAGTGSGTVSGIMGFFSQPQGKVNSYDIRDVALDQAKKNVKQMGISHGVEINKGNILEEEVEIGPIDFILLDLATPWSAVEKVKHYLSSEGRICLFSPTIEQVKKNILALREQNFKEIITIEQLQRTFQVKPNATRPRGRMVGHTGYLTFAGLSSPLINPRYTQLYSPGNIGNLLIYGNLQPKYNILILSYHKSPLPEIIKLILSHSLHLHVIILEKDDPMIPLKEQLQTISNSHYNSNPDEIFDSILIDNIEIDNLIGVLDPYLVKSGAISAISSNFEHMKSMYDQMELKHYYNVFSFELICRKIHVGEKVENTFSESIPHQGYLTFGRKVIDDVGPVNRKPKIDEFVEPLLDVAVKFAEETKPEPEKIDYANIRQ